MRRNFLCALALASACLLFSACGAHDTPAPGAANANAATGSNAPGAYQGAGPHNAGIGGTGGNANAVSGNTNIAPPGVGTNSNAGASNTSR